MRHLLGAAHSFPILAQKTCQQYVMFQRVSLNFLIRNAAADSRQRQCQERMTIRNCASNGCSLLPRAGFLTQTAKAFYLSRLELCRTCKKIRSHCMAPCSLPARDSGALLSQRKNLEDVTLPDSDKYVRFLISISTEARQKTAVFSLLCFFTNFIFACTLIIDKRKQRRTIT